MKLCIDCRHMGPLNIIKDGSDITHCYRKGFVKDGISPVTGKPYTEKTEIFCELDRQGENDSRCGPDARFFEPKEKEAA